MVNAWYLLSAFCFGFAAGGFTILKFWKWSGC